MRSITGICILMLIFKIGVKCSPQNDVFKLLFPEAESSNTTTAPRPTPSTSTAVPQDDYLQNISIQDILSLGIDENEKIQKKIVNAMSEFSSNYQNYKVIKLSAKNYSLPQKSIKFVTTQGSVLFQNLVVEESYQTSNNRKHETVVGCDLQGSAKVQASLPHDIKITAEIVITSSSSKEMFKQGSITVHFENGALSKHKQLITSTNVSDSGSDGFSKITYDSSVHVNTDSQSYKLVYKEVEAFLNKLESSLEAFLTTQLDDEITKRNISFLTSCSKLVNMRQDQKKINSMLFNNRINYLYVIPNVKVETWNKIVLSAGPVVIEGLSNFTSSETIVVDVDDFVASSDCNKTLVIRIKTGTLKGKFEWHYNFKKNNTDRTLVFFFSVDHIQFESKIYRYYEYTRKKNDYDEYTRKKNDYDYYGYSSSTYSYDQYRAHDQGPLITVHIGEIEIETSESKFCEYETTFVNIVLSEYLKSIIVESLTNSIKQEIDAKRSLFLQSFNNF